jgi:hypothetical protein
MRARPTEKRRQPRIQPYVARCRVLHDSRRTPGYLTELSLEGLRVACNAEAPPLGARVVVEVRLGSRVAYSRLPGQVRWIGAALGADRAFGITFERLSDEERAALQTVVEEFRRRAAQLA